MVGHFPTMVTPAHVAAQGGRPARRQGPQRAGQARAGGVALQIRAPVTPHQRPHGQGAVGPGLLGSGWAAVGRRSSGLTTCPSPATVTCVYSAVVPMR